MPKIKNPKTKMFVAIKSLKSDFRLALSGTPIVRKKLTKYPLLLFFQRLQSVLLHHIARVSLNWV
jgi:hypothetical protein